MSPFYLRIRLQHRAALPACSDGEVKGHAPLVRAVGLMVQSHARASEGCCEQPPP